jgi:uncharacterized membrane protein
MSTRNVLLFLHIVVAVVTMGPLLLFDMIAPKLIRSGDAGAVRLVERMTNRLGPATVAIAVLGVIMVIRHDAYSFSQAWVSAALGLYVLVVANGAGVLSRTGSKALAKVEAGEPALDEARTMAIAGAVNIVMVLTIFWLMVAKPGL